MELFLEAGFGVLLGKIAYPAVVKFFKKSKSSDTLLRRLKISLLSIDAEEKQLRNASVKEWMEELKEVVFDADDAMDEICTYAKIGEVTMNPNSTTSVNLHNAEIEQKVQDIIERLDLIIKQKNMLQLQMVKEVKIPTKIPTSSVW